MEGTTYYVEGTDCVGKDTMGPYIAETMDIPIIQKLSLHNNNPWDNDRTGELPSDHPLIPAYLVRSAIWDILNYEPHIDQVQISFTAPRSAAWQLTAGGYFADVFSELVTYTPQFEHPILLHASIGAKQARLLQREGEEGKPGSAIDKLAFSNPTFVQKMDENLRRLTVEGMGATIIDTTGMTIEEVQSLILETIRTQQITQTNSDKKAALRSELKRFYNELVHFSRTEALSKGLPDTAIERVIFPFTREFRDI